MARLVNRALASRTWCVAAALVTLAASVDAAPRGGYDRIVVFGTSLSDSGNAFALLGGVNTPPDFSVDPFLVPDRPYAKGGHHFTNGSTWIEMFANAQGAASSANPAFRGADPGATNYAVGAARAYDDGVNVDLGQQLEAFLHDSGGTAPADALYVIEMGGNDVRDALATYAAGGNGALVIEQSLSSITGAVQTLHAAGARHFLIWSAPNVALTPAIRALDRVSPGAAGFASQLTAGFNAGLAGVVAQLAGLPDIHITRLDAFRLLNDIVLAPAKFGLKNVTDACINTVAPFVCARPDEYLFWDGVHPTRTVHEVIAQEAAVVLAH